MTSQNGTSSSREAGFSLVEAVVVISIVAILSGFAVLNLKDLQNPADNAGRELLAYFRAVRGKAMATTSTYTVWAASATQVQASSSTACSSVDQVLDPVLTLRLPTGAQMLNTAWSVCYNSRGLANNSADIPVQDSRVTRTVRFVLGGGVKLE